MPWFGLLIGGKKYEKSKHTSPDHSRLNLPYGSKATKTGNSPSSTVYYRAGIWRLTEKDVGEKRAHRASVLFGKQFTRVYNFTRRFPCGRTFQQDAGPRSK